MRIFRGRVLAVGTAALGVSFGLAWAPGVASAAGTTWSVSPTGSGGAAGSDCGHAGFSKISDAVAAAHTGDTINVCAGTYKETVAVTKQLTITGPTTGSPAILDAVNQLFGITVGGGPAAGAAASGTIVEHLTVENAKRSGIAVGDTNGVNLLNNIVTYNDQMCQPQLSFDDCGESIDLEAVTNSVIDHNTVTHGSGGILLSDGIPPGSIGQTAFGTSTNAYGPSHGNTISNNTVADNIWDCGITMPSHNSNAVKNGVPNTNPATGGGVFHNTVIGNTVTGNGTAGGGGAGILMAAPFPGTGSYGNTIQNNTVSGSGIAGITIHSHAPGQDVNGNQLIGNTLLTNAVGETIPGTGLFTTATTAGDADAGDPATTAILVYSAVVPITGTVISNNTIKSNHYGSVLENTAGDLVSGNTYSGVTVPVYHVPAPDSGYAMAGTNGSVLHFGNSPSWGDSSALKLAAPVVGVARTPMAGGYWLAATDGGVFAYGDARFHGSLGNVKLVQPIVGIASTLDGHGYWMVAKDGGVFAFGDAGFFGSLGGVKLDQPVVGIVPTSHGLGYWLVAKDGGVFAFGDARFHGSTGGIHLAQPVVGMAATSDDGGYWLVASDGGVFAFGNSAFMGSMGGVKLAAPVTGISSTSDDGGYWMVGSDGGIFRFGDAPFHGSGSGHTTAPVVGMFANGIAGAG